MSRNIKNRLKKGFTLAEMLMVVAIIGILAAFGFVNTAHYQKTLKQTELDNMAREIFVAAQNHATVSDASGSWESYVKKSSVQLGTAMPDKPSDYDQAVTDAGYQAGDAEWAWGTWGKDAHSDSRHAFYSIAVTEDASSDSNSILSLLLPYDSIDETLRKNGNIIIEYDSKTAAVYGVWYSESEITDYPSLNSLRDTDQENKKDDRMNHKPQIGYYGGAVQKNKNADGDTLEPISAVIINNDKLTLEVSVPQKKSITSSAARNYNLAATVKGDLSGKEKEIILWNEDKSLTKTDKKHSDGVDQEGNGKYRYYIYNLDSVTNGKDGHFAAKFPEFIPGENLTITVRETLANSKANNVEETAVLHANSLFANGSNNTKDTALIAYGRHLENLSSNISNVNKTSKITISSAEVVRDIDWSKFIAAVSDEDKSSTDNIGDIVERSRSTKNINDYEKNKTSENGAFYSIHNTKLKSFDGNNYKISNLILQGIEVKPIKGDGSNVANTSKYGAGLFADVEIDTGVKQFDISNVTLVDPSFIQVEDQNLKAAGFLIGQTYQNSTDSMTMTNCHVVGTSGKTLSVLLGNNHSIHFAGGLIGSVSGNNTIKDSDIIADNIVISGTSGAGGLVGHYYAESLSIDNCKVGNNDSVITITSSRGSAGGAIGDVAYNPSTFSRAKVEIENSVVSGNNIKVEAFDSAGGLAGNVRVYLSLDKSSVHSTGTVFILGGAVENGTELTRSASSGFAGGLVGQTGSSVHIGDQSNVNADELRVYARSNLSGVAKSSDDKRNMAGGLIGGTSKSIRIGNTQEFNISDSYINVNALDVFAGVEQDIPIDGRAGDQGATTYNHCALAGGAFGYLRTAGLHTVLSNITVEAKTQLLVRSDQMAGGMIAEYLGTGGADITNCHVVGAGDNDLIEGGNYVGGFAGYLSMQRSGALKIDQCSASAYVRKDGNLTQAANDGDQLEYAPSGVGGFIGDVRNINQSSSITNSYAGGRTSGGKYGTTADSHTAGRFNVQWVNPQNHGNNNNISNGGNGGFIGTLEVGSPGYTLQIDNCYTTASVFTDAKDSTSAAAQVTGSFIGHAYKNASDGIGNITVTNCYSTGLIETTQTLNGTAQGFDFFGKVDDAVNLHSLSTSNYYLKGINKNEITGLDSSKYPNEVIGASDGDANTPFARQSNVSTKKYDASLTTYPYKTVTAVNVDGTAYNHVGDWPTKFIEEKKDFSVDNGNKLEVKITVPGDQEYTTLAVTGKTSKQTQYVVLKKNNNSNILQAYFQPSYWDADYFLGHQAANTNKSKHGYQANNTDGTVTYTVWLDDISISGGHFADVMAKLYPGEDITITALSGISKVSDTSKIIGTPVATNSIYAYSADDSEKHTALISNIRHLENLSDYVSHVIAKNNSNGVNDGINITNAVQNRDIKWNDSSDQNAFVQDINSRNSIVGINNGIKIYNYWNGEASNNQFVSIENKNLESYDAKKTDNDNYVLEGLNIAESNSGSGGIFKEVYTQFNLKNTDIADVTVNSDSNPAGVITGLIKSGASLTIEHVNVTGTINSKSGTDAGVLVGQVDSNSTLTVNNVKITSDQITMSAENDSGLIAAWVNAGSTVNVNGLTITNNERILESKSAIAGGLFGVVRANDGEKLISLQIESVNLNGAGMNVTGTGNNAGIVAGVIEGQSNVELKDLTINEKAVNVVSNSSASAGGLIGRFGKGGSGSKLTASSITVSGDTFNVTSTSSGNPAGGMIGDSYTSNDSTISDISFNSKTITVNGSTSGGLIGSQHGDAAISSITFAGDALNVNGTGDAGGLIGSAENTIITNAKISALNSQIKSANSSAGGLIGKISPSRTASITSSIIYGNDSSVSAYGDAGGFIGTVTGSGNTNINDSAASVYVESTRDSNAARAGGFIGKVDNTGITSITASYVGGHTSAGQYTSANEAERFSSNVQGNAGSYVGGFIGEHAKKDDNNIGILTVKYCYTTASAYSYGNSSTNNSSGSVGGFIGADLEKTTIEYSYAAGKVSSDNNLNVKTFTGKGNGNYNNDYVLAGVNDKLPTGEKEDSASTGITESSDDNKDMYATETEQAIAYPYDSTLIKNQVDGTSQYPYRTAYQLTELDTSAAESDYSTCTVAKTHYGDWVNTGTLTIITETPDESDNNNSAETAQTEESNSEAPEEKKTADVEEQKTDTTEISEGTASSPDSSESSDLKKEEDTEKTDTPSDTDSDSTDPSAADDNVKKAEETDTEKGDNSSESDEIPGSSSAVSTGGGTGDNGLIRPVKFHLLEEESSPEPTADNSKSEEDSKETIEPTVTPDTTPSPTAAPETEEQSSDTFKEEKQVVIGSEFDLSTIKPVREGYTLAGWKVTEKEDTVSDVKDQKAEIATGDNKVETISYTYKPDDVITIEGDMTLEAVWAKNGSEGTGSDGVFTDWIPSRSTSDNPYPGNTDNCTWTAWQLVYDTLDMKLPAWGNAGSWLIRARAAGYTVSSRPRKNALVVFSNHVGFVSDVSEDGQKVFIKEGNYLGRYHEGWWPASGARHGMVRYGYIYLGDGEEAESDITSEEIEAMQKEQEELQKQEEGAAVEILINENEYNGESESEFLASIGEKGLRAGNRTEEESEEAPGTVLRHSYGCYQIDGRVDYTVAVEKKEENKQPETEDWVEIRQDQFAGKTEEEFLAAIKDLGLEPGERNVVNENTGAPEGTILKHTYGSFAKGQSLHVDYTVQGAAESKPVEEPAASPTATPSHEAVPSPEETEPDPLPTPSYEAAPSPEETAEPTPLPTPSKDAAAETAQPAQTPAAESPVPAPAPSEQPVVTEQPPVESTPAQESLPAAMPPVEAPALPAESPADSDE